MNSDTPLVLLHAFPLSSAMYAALATELRPLECDLLTPDLRGFGNVPLGTDEPSLDRMADDVAAVLDDRGSSRCVLGGLSMGGYVTMAMLRRHPDRVAGVILLDTKAGADSEQAQENRLRMADKVLEHGTRALIPMIDTLLGETTRRERPDVVSAVTGWVNAAAPEAVAWAQRAMAARPDSFDTLRTVDVPAAVVVGEEDVLSTVDDAQSMADAIDHPVPVHVIPRAGHLSAVEAPGVVASAITEVVNRSV